MVAALVLLLAASTADAGGFSQFSELLATMKKVPEAELLEEASGGGRQGKALEEEEVGDVPRSREEFIYHEPSREEVEEEDEAVQASLNEVEQDEVEKESTKKSSYKSRTGDRREGSFGSEASPYGGSKLLTGLFSSVDSAGRPFPASLGFPTVMNFMQNFRTGWGFPRHRPASTSREGRGRPRRRGPPWITWYRFRRRSTIPIMCCITRISDSLCTLHIHMRLRHTTRCRCTMNSMCQCILSPIMRHCMYLTCPCIMMCRMCQCILSPIMHHCMCLTCRCILGLMCLMLSLYSLLTTLSHILIHTYLYQSTQNHLYLYTHLMSPTRETPTT